MDEVDRLVVVVAVGGFLDGVGLSFEVLYLRADGVAVEHLVANVVHELHRGEILVGRVGRAVVGAPGTLGAGIGVE